LRNTIHTVFILVCLALGPHSATLTAEVAVSRDCFLALGDDPGARPAAELNTEFNVLSWNIRKASGDGWMRDLAKVGGGVDLAFIQEASVRAGIPQVLQQPMFPAFAQGYSTPDQQTGVMTLSAGEPAGRCALTAREPWLGTPKATGVTEYLLAGTDDRLLAINVHAVNFEFGLQNFRAQFYNLRNILAAHSGPVILAGDLNTWSRERQELVDAFAAEFGLNSVGFEPDLRSTAFGRALDHIYVRGLRAIATSVIPVSSSDHNPLRVRLALH